MFVYKAIPLESRIGDFWNEVFLVLRGLWNCSPSRDISAPGPFCIVGLNMLPWDSLLSNLEACSLAVLLPWTNHLPSHYNDVIMTTMASQITSLKVAYSTVYSDADQRKHQSSASLAFVWGIHRDRWIPRTKGQLRGKCFHLITSSCLCWSTFGSIFQAAVGF